jgi:hypothetical protein
MPLGTEMHMILSVAQEYEQHTQVCGSEATKGDQENSVIYRAGPFQVS